jgi:hypothetical protein
MNIVGRRAKALVVAAGFGLGACSSGTGTQTGTTEEAIGSTPQRLVGQDTYLYFRCNSTSWDVTDASRLTTGDNPNVLELTYTVREPYMTDAGDDCALTETPEKNKWGNWQRYYGVYGDRLNAVGSAYVRDQVDGGGINFRIKYPSLGRYRVLVDWREGYVSVRKEAPVSSEVAWTLPGQFTTGQSPAAGTPGALYHLATPPNRPVSTLSRIGTDGKPRWIRDIAGNPYLTDSCLYGDVAVVKDGNTLRGLSPDTGAAVWTNTSPDGDVASFYPICPITGRRIYTSTELYDSNYGLRQQRIRAIDRVSGATLWQRVRTAKDGEPALSYESLAFTGADTAVINGYGDNQTTYRVLDAANGQEKWNATFTGYATYLTFDELGQAYRVTNDDATNAHRIERLASSDGRKLWSFDSNDGTYIYPALERGTLQVRLTTEIVRLSPATGARIWSIPLVAQGSSYPYTTLLPSGNLALVVGDYETQTARVSYVEGATGQVRWTKTYTAVSYASLEEDARGNVYVRAVNDFSKVSKADGSTLWTFHYTPSQQYGDNLSSLFEGNDDLVYLSYAVGYKYASVGVIKIDGHDGSTIWKTPTLGIGLRFLQSDATRFYLASYIYGTGAGTALLK